MIIRVILFVYITLRLIDTFMRDYPGNCIVIIFVPVLHLLRQHPLWVINTFMSHREITQVNWMIICYSPGQQRDYSGKWMIICYSPSQQRDYTQVNG